MSSLAVLAAVHLWENTGGVGIDQNDVIKVLQQDMFDSWYTQSGLCYNKQRIQIGLDFGSDAMMNNSSENENGSLQKHDR